MFPVAGDATVEYELKPDPVRVTVSAAEPTTRGVVLPVDAVITGATLLATPTPKAPARFVTVVLLPAPVPLVTVKPQASGVATDVTTIVAVPVVGLVMADVARAFVTVTPLTVSVAVLVISVKQAALSVLVRDTVAPYSKPEPSKATAILPVAAVAEGLTFSRPLWIVNEPAAETPPSVFVTTTLYAPIVAAAPPDGFVGVTLKTMEVALMEVTDDVKDVPSVPFANATVAPVAKPVPVMVTVVGPVPSQTELGVIDEMTGAASTMIAPATDALAPLASVRIAEHVPATTPVEVKSAVAVVADVSAKLLKVTAVPEVQVAAKPTPIVAPLSAKPEPVIATVPVIPAALSPTALAVAP